MAYFHLLCQKNVNKITYFRHISWNLAEMPLLFFPDYGQMGGDRIGNVNQS